MSMVRAPSCRRVRASFRVHRNPNSVAGALDAPRHCEINSEGALCIAHAGDRLAANFRSRHHQHRTLKSLELRERAGQAFYNTVAERLRRGIAADIGERQNGEMPRGLNLGSRKYLQNRPSNARQRDCHHCDRNQKNRSSRTPSAREPAGSFARSDLRCGRIRKRLGPCVRPSSQPLQVVNEIFHSLIALLGIFLQRLLDDVRRTRPAGRAAAREETAVRT